MCGVKCEAAYYTLHTAHFTLPPVNNEAGTALRAQPGPASFGQFFSRPPIALCSAAPESRAVFGFRRECSMFSFQCSVFSVQFSVCSSKHPCTLHTTHFTLVTSHSSPTLRTGPASIARSIRLSSGSSHQYRSPGTNRGFCEADLKLSTFSLNLWPLVWSLWPAPAACKIESRTTTHRVTINRTAAAMPVETRRAAGIPMLAAGRKSSTGMLFSQPLASSRAASE